VDRLDAIDRPESVPLEYEKYRRRGQSGWGLAWYLSYEVCSRYYCSHGITPYVIDHEGLGYYGIALEYRACHAKDVRTLGRFTVQGDVENWRTGTPGDHGLELVERARRGEALSSLVQSAIRHLDLPLYPEKAHTYCHHKRRGQSYVLLWEVAALVALRDEDEVEIWNHAYHTQALASRHDPEYVPASEPAELLDYFLFDGDQRQVLVRGDGAVILPAGAPSLWERYMRGESAGDLAVWVEDALGLAR